MKWNIKLGRFLGIDVYLHVTFLIVLAFLTLANWLATRQLGAALGGAIFFAAIFLCVLLHEYGHALMARRFGVGTKDITLLPIGGVARLERIPDKPAQEFWIAVAGPAVNIVIAALLAVWLGLANSFEPIANLSATSGGLAERLLMVNLFLVLFNLLPAFPMDGGRVLRSLLAMKLHYRRATHIAARLGQGMAFLFALAGLFANPMLLLIALFVWIGASQELNAAEARSATAGLPVRHAMITDFRSLRPDDSLGAVARLVLAGSQQDFPVTENGTVIGLLERRHLLDGLARLGPDSPVSAVMLRQFPTVAPHDMLETILARQQHAEFPLLPVVVDGRLVGLLTVENMAELFLIRSALDAEPHNHTKGSRLQAIISRPPPLPFRLQEGA